MVQVTYRAPDGDEAVVTMGGVRFFDGQAQDLDEDAPELASLIAKCRDNPHFDVEGEGNQHTGIAVTTGPTTIQTAGSAEEDAKRIAALQAEIARLSKRDENGDTEEMAALRAQFNTAWADLKGKYDKALADLAALQGQHALKAEHHGGGKFNITRGEAVLASGLSKKDADAFNGLSEEEKAEYVQGLKAE